MSVHKLTPGDGYTYLLRQVAAMDATTRGAADLATYYSEKGESPGVWMGRGCAAVPDFPPLGEQVTEAQMRALFGEGRHPNADAIERAAIAAGLSPAEVDKASRLGKPFLIHAESNVFRRRCAEAFRDYNLTRGLVWDAPVPEEQRARIRTDIARAMFIEEFGRPPADARELSGHLARISRQATTAVAGYDLTFSPVKSVSTLWAIAPLEVARIIEQAHADAVADTLRWLEDNAAYTRVGAGGVAQVDVQGLIAAAFTHRDSRAGDPDLHTHVAVSNKVQTLDGRWLALDGRTWFKLIVAASERYNTRLEVLLIERLGVRFAERPSHEAGKRPVREIVGVEGELPRRWSARRSAIDVRRAELSAKFQADHGRPPTAVEAIALAQQATLETRQRKHEPRSYAEQRATWRAEALSVLGGEARLHYYLRDTLRGGQRRYGRQQRTAATRVTRRWIEQAADQVLHSVQSERAVWQPNHLRAEAERHVRAANIRAADVDRAVDAVVTATLSSTRSVPLREREAVTAAGRDPAKLRRADGGSVFTVAGTARYTSAEIIAAEQAIVAAAGRRDGRTVARHVLEQVLINCAADGVELNPGQVHLVRELATSGARVQLALAPAGTGKTTAMRALSQAWTGSGGAVVGLAPSAAAAAVLREEINTDTDTLAKLTWHITGRDRKTPTWLERVGPHTLVVIDEAGMAGTTDLAAAIDYITERGGSVRLVGDDQQLAAIGAGGVLRDLAHTHGAVTLSQVMRFVHPDTGAPNRAEGAASLALRDGDPAAIGYYLDHGRVHVGDLGTCTSDVYTAWAADRARGVDAVMLAPTRALAAELNQRARIDRLTTSGQPAGPEVSLADGSSVSVSDTILTRHNDRRIRLSATDWVKNGDRWRVHAVHQDGALEVIHLRSGRRVTLPASYVAAHVELGYAATVHGAQGLTADTCYVIVTGDESRQLLYVALTRGRHANHLYLTVAGDGDPHSVITRDALLPPTAADILARILAYDDSPLSATTQQRELARPELLLQAAAARYHHALGVAAEDHLGADALAQIDAAVDRGVPGLTGEPAYPTLRGHLALLACDGLDPVAELTRAAAQRELHTAADTAAVLDSRLDPTGRHSARTGPLPWLPGIPARLSVDPDWGTYLAQRAAHVTEFGAAVAEQTRAWTPTSAPTWALPLIGRDPQLLADLAVWRVTHSVADTDRRPTGPPQPALADARTQRALDQRITRLLGDPHTATARWAPVAAGIDLRIPADPYWPTLAERLTTADRAGIDVIALLRSVAADGPLPDEQPAAALWWRLAGHLSPAAATATDHSESATLRPAWTPTLAGIIGHDTAARVIADPAWPALVAAVTHAGRAGWDPQQILSTSYDLLGGAQPDDEPLRPDELATALAMRIGLLTDPDPAALSSPANSDPAGVDEEWMASVLADEPHRIESAQAPYDDSQPPDVSQDWGEEWPAPDEPIRDPIADTLAQLELADQQRHDADRQRAEYWANAAVPRARLVELNALAEQFFTRHYTDAWAPEYVRDRLGTDLADDQRFHVGYAPDHWTLLTAHLRRNGATDEEILAAGLATRARARNGSLIDRFRDRLIFPIKAADPANPAGLETRGFIGRRRPAITDNNATGRSGGPKYLNTPDTGLFTKGRELYGLADHAAALAAGGSPVLVEGPMDAIAATLAGTNPDSSTSYIGVAPLGTACTDQQADALRPYLSTRPHPEGQPPRAPIIVGTDTDRAGRHAAHRAYWQLVARGEDPHQLTLPHGKDPAEYLQTHGPQDLRAQLDTAPPLADQITADRTAPYHDQLDTIEGRLRAARQAADILAARPASTWHQGAIAIATKYGIAPATAINEVLTAGTAWTEDPRGRARQRLTERPPEPTATPPHQPTDPTLRWAPLAAELTGGKPAALLHDPHWPVLADHLTRAEATGYDVPNRLHVLAAQQPLPGQHTARCLDLRLIDDHPPCLPPPNPDLERDRLHHIAQAAAERVKAAAEEAPHQRGHHPARPAAPTTTPTPTPPQRHRPAPPPPHRAPRR